MDNVSNLQHTPVMITTFKKTETSGIKKTLLTPCRQIGLKRKRSLLCSPRGEQTSDSPVTTKINNLIVPGEIDGNVKMQENVKTKVTPLANTPSSSKVRQSLALRKPLHKQNLSRHNHSEEDEVAVDRVHVNEKSQMNYNEDKVIGNYSFTKPDVVTCEMIASLTQVIGDKFDQVQKQELTAIYAKKHDLQILSEITKKWKVGCQDALRELLIVLADRGTKISMTKLLSEFRIPHNFIGYNEETEDFE